MRLWWGIESYMYLDDNEDGALRAGPGGFVAWAGAALALPVALGAVATCVFACGRCSPDGRVIGEKEVA